MGRFRPAPKGPLGPGGPVPEPPVPVNPPDGWTTYPDCPGCGCEECCLPCDACRGPYPCQYEVSIPGDRTLEAGCVFAVNARVTMTGECLWTGFLDFRPFVYRSVLLRVFWQEQLQRPGAELEVRNLLEPGAPPRRYYTDNFNCCGTNVIPPQAGNPCTTPATVTPVRVGGQCECGAPITCVCGGRHPSNLTGRLVNFFGAACLNGLEAPFLPVSVPELGWRGTFRLEVPCGSPSGMIVFLRCIHSPDGREALDIEDY